MNDTARNGHAAFTAVIHADRATIDARGELEIFTVDLLRGALAHLALHQPAHITINLSEVSTIDGYSARLLLRWLDTGATNCRATLTLRDPNAHVAAILEAKNPAPPAAPPRTRPRQRRITSRASQHTARKSALVDTG